ncbi:MAG: hypothetical protein HUJ72_09345 [Blautia sp.]|nr:hypothetical protein [Blautia sp.]
MWSTDNRQKNRKAAIAGGYAGIEVRDENDGKLSCAMAMLLGFIVTFEIMIAGAMVINLDFHEADIISVVLVFMVIYFGVVAALTNR